MPTTVLHAAQADIADENVYDKLLWPYFSPRFASMMEVWGGIPPTIHHGFDEASNQQFRC